MIDISDNPPFFFFLFIGIISFVAMGVASVFYLEKDHKHKDEKHKHNDKHKAKHLKKA